jgi:hypothetical protein
MRKVVTLIVLVLFIASGTAYAIKAEKYQLEDSFSSESLQDCNLQYYYYIPCPVESWFWGFYQWEQNDIIGQYFVIGDAPTGVHSPCDPEQCHTLEYFRVLDFAGYGTIYPGDFTVEFDVWCCDVDGCPVGPSLWNSGPFETGPPIDPWNYVYLDSAIYLTSCCIDAGPPASHPRILITAKHTGAIATYPSWGADNISTPIDSACTMHDLGCLEALYPRPTSSHYAAIHSGYYGIDFEYCPPLWFLDARDETPGGTLYGFVEFAWRIHLLCLGPDPNATEPTTWGSVKSLYR